MAQLSYQARKSLPNSTFALPGRRYPLPDASHARNALARVSQFGSSEEKAKVRAAVHSRYPNIGRDAMVQHMHGSGEADRHSYPRTSNNLGQAFHGSKGADQELERGLPIHGSRGVPASGARGDLTTRTNFAEGMNRGVSRGTVSPGGSRGSGAQFQYVGAKGHGTATPGRPPQALQYVGARGGQGHGGVGTRTARASSGAEGYSFSGRGPNNAQPFSGSHGTPDRGARAYFYGKGANAATTRRGVPRMPGIRPHPSRTHYVDPNNPKPYLGTYR